MEPPRKAGRPLPVEDPAELYSYDSLDSFLTVFWLVQEVLVERDDWARIAFESLVDAAAHGLVLLETAPGGVNGPGAATPGPCTAPEGASRTGVNR